MISVNNVSKDFGEGLVLQPTTVTFNPGDVTVIVGPSGSGKSTLLRCLNFLEVPSSGTVTIGDLVVNESPKVLQQVRTKTAMVFQSFHLFNHLTVLENVTLALKTVLKQDKLTANKKALETLARVGMDSFAHRNVKLLSGGQKQRVAIARALAMEPDVLLFDEPTSALDPEMVYEVADVIRQISEDNITMILVTHEMHLAKEIADRVIFMDEGRIVEDREKDTLFTNPNTERAKAFLHRMVI